jgi:hypothetical protein
MLASANDTNWRGFPTNATHVGTLDAGGCGPVLASVEKVPIRVG